MDGVDGSVEWVIPLKLLLLRTGAPAVLKMRSIDSLDRTHQCFLKMFGIHGVKFALQIIKNQSWIISFYPSVNLTSLKDRACSSGQC